MTTGNGWAGGTEGQLESPELAASLLRCFAALLLGELRSRADAVQWVERIAVEVLADATAGIWPKIPQEDIELDIIRVRGRR